MMRIVTKWRIHIVFDRNGNDIPDQHVKTFWVSNDYLSNVLRQVADMQFTKTGLEQPLSISVEQEP